MRGLKLLGLIMIFGFLMNHTETVYAADTTWQNDYTYTIDGSNIKLQKYNGSSISLTVPSKAIISDVEYTTYIQGDDLMDPSWTSIWKDAINLKSLSFESGIQLGSTLRGLFSECSNLTSIDISNLNTAGVADMMSMFEECSGLSSLNIGGINTSSVDNMSAMFHNCSSLESLDLSGLNTSNVTNMSTMFYDCTNLATLNLSGFNTSKVTTMQGMFLNCSSLSSLNFSSFSTASVTDMSIMFSGCSALTSLDLTGFTTNSVTSMAGMFTDCTNLSSLDLSNFDMSNTIDIDGFMTRCTSIVSLRTSKNLLKSISLPATFYDTTYNFYTELPKNQSVSKVLTKGPANASEAKIIVSDQVYTGRTLTPAPIITLSGITIPADSYTLSYTDNIKAGKANVTAKFKGNFTGSASGQFNITHTHSPQVIPAVAASENTTGLTEGSKCSVCGEILKAQEVVPKLAHVHTPVAIPAVAATEKSTGLTEGSKCSKCGQVLKEQQVIPKVVIKINEKGATEDKNYTYVLDGNTVQLKVNTENLNNPKVTWSIPKKQRKWATVNARGVVRAKKAGVGHKVKVVATIEYEPPTTLQSGNQKFSLFAFQAFAAVKTHKINKVYYIHVEDRKNKVKKVSIKSSKSTVKAGKSIKMKLNTDVKNFNSKRASWSIPKKQKKYATISNGKLKTKKSAKGKKIKVICKISDSKKTATKTIKVK